MDGHGSADDRLLDTLQRLLAIPAPDLRSALDQASTLVAEALAADKVDVFLYEATTETLVAAGTSLTEMGRRQHEIGLDRLPVANDGPVVRVFLTGEPYLTGRADEDPDQIRGAIEALGVRSEAVVPLVVDGERRGVLSATSTRSDAFTEREVGFLAAVANWIGMVAHRVEGFERAIADAERRGQERAAVELGRHSPRQREVAILVAAGLTNAEIARRLTLVEGTVANHVEHITRKLRLRSRTQVATWAVQHGLYRLGDEDDAD